MKKNLILLLAIIFFMSCERDKDDDSIIVIKTEDIEGQWVTDVHTYNQGEETYIWECMKFFSSGKLYYSGCYDKTVGDSAISFENNDIPADYNIKDNCITIKSKIDDQQTSLIVNNIYQIKRMSDLEFEALVTSANDTIGTFTYSRVVGECKIGKEEYKPDYNSMIPGLNILDYYTNNDCVAQVDKDGVITGIASGSAFIYLKTDQGLAAVRVDVKAFLEHDYDKFIGKKKENFINTMGDSYYKEGSHIYYFYGNTNLAWLYNTYYKRRSGNWDVVAAQIDNYGFVTAITMEAKDNIQFSTDEMTNYLSSHYYVYEKGTDGHFKAFINAPVFDDADVGITWDEDSRVLTFVIISKRIHLKIGKETFMPNYDELTSGATIINCFSENEYVATIDTQTGAITGHDSGNTIIDVQTDQGMVYIDLTVNVFLAEDYESLINGTKSDVVDFFGNVPFSAPDNIEGFLVTFNSILFPELRRKVGNWESMLIKMTNKVSGVVTSIELTAKTDVWFTSEEMDQYLSGRYTYYEKDSEGNVKAYVNNADYGKASVELLWDMNKKVLTFQMLTHDEGLPKYDFGRYLGKTHDEAVEMMKSEYSISPSSDDGSRLSYTMSGDVFLIMFKYDSNEAINYILVRLETTVDPNAVNEELSKTYILLDDSAGNYSYASNNGKVRVTYMPSTDRWYNYIQFTVRQ